MKLIVTIFTTLLFLSSNAQDSSSINYAYKRLQFAVKAAQFYKVGFDSAAPELRGWLIQNDTFANVVYWLTENTEDKFQESYWINQVNIRYNKLYDMKILFWKKIALGLLIE